MGDTVAQQAYDDFLLDYADLAAEPCDVNLTGQPLAGQSLTPGVYCFDTAVTEAGGQLTLGGPSDGIWIFQIGILGTGALTGTNFSVVMPGGETCSNNVFWWTAEGATLTDSVFLGSIWFLTAGGGLRSTSRTLPDLVDELGLHPAGEPVWHVFPGQGGITGVLLLSESHLACHTFPERGFAAFDLCCCRPFQEWPWAERLADALGAAEVRVRSVPRGELRAATAFAHDSC